MNLKRNLSLVFAVSTVSVFGIASNALAGEGGAAGAASFNLTTGSINAGQVDRVAVAASVGKMNAFANAMNQSGSNTAYALGSAGSITTSTYISSYYDYSLQRYVYAPLTNVSGDTDYNPGAAQSNSLNSPQTIRIGTQSGAPVVQLGNSYYPY
jgi:hypothetical protein